MTVKEIKARHKETTDFLAARGQKAPECHEDRAFLIAELEAMTESRDEWMDLADDAKNREGQERAAMEKAEADLAAEKERADGLENTRRNLVKELNDTAYLLAARNKSISDDNSGTRQREDRIEFEYRRAEAAEKRLALAEKVVANAKDVFTVKRPGYHDCLDDGLPECEWCLLEKALAAYDARGGKP